MRSLLLVVCSVSLVNGLLDVDEFNEFEILQTSYPEHDRRLAGSFGSSVGSGSGVVSPTPPPPTPPVPTPPAPTPPAAGVDNVVRCQNASNFRDECECPHDGAVPLENGCIDKAYACHCTTCCQDFNVSSKYDDFRYTMGMIECAEIAEYGQTFGPCSMDLSDRTATYNPRYRGIFPLGCGLSIAWNYQDPVENGFEQVQFLNNTCDVAGYYANAQGLFTAVTDDVNNYAKTVCFQEKPSFSGYLLVAGNDLPDIITSASLTMAAPIAETEFDSVNSSLNLVPTAVTINDAAINTLSASSSFWKNTWYDTEPNLPQRCIGLIMQCLGSPKVWRLCRTGGYGQSDASVQVTLMYHTPTPPTPPTPVPQTPPTPVPQTLHDSETDRGSPANASIPIFVVLLFVITFEFAVLSNNSSDVGKYLASLWFLFLVYACCVMDFGDGGRLTQLQSIIEESDTDGDKARAWLGTLALVGATGVYVHFIETVSSTTKQATERIAQRGLKREKKYFVYGLVAMFAGIVAIAALIAMVVGSSHQTVVETAAYIAIGAVILSLLIISMNVSKDKFGNYVFHNAFAKVTFFSLVVVFGLIYVVEKSGIWEFIMVTMMFCTAALHIATEHGGFTTTNFTLFGRKRDSHHYKLATPAPTRRHNWKREAKFVLRV